MKKYLSFRVCAYIDDNHSLSIETTYNDPYIYKIHIVNYRDIKFDYSPDIYLNNIDSIYMNKFASNIKNVFRKILINRFERGWKHFDINKNITIDINTINLIRLSFFKGLII